MTGSIRYGIQKNKRVIHDVIDQIIDIKIMGIEGRSCDSSLLAESRNPDLQERFLFQHNQKGILNMIACALCPHGKHLFAHGRPSLIPLYHRQDKE